MINEQELGAKAKQFAKRFVTLREALEKQGVPSTDAKELARSTALDLMFEPPEGDGAKCPLCGRSCACIS